MPAPAQIAMHRHLHAMSEKDVDAVVHAVADLIVNYLAAHPESLRRTAPTPAAPRLNRPATKVAHLKETRE